MKLNYLEQKTLHPDLQNESSLVQKMINPLLSETDSVELIKTTPKQICTDVVLRQAVAFMREIAQNQLKTMIVGDYDCDGLCSTTMLVRLCEKLGMEPGYYIPNRISEGYGLSSALVEQAHQKGYQVLITVDNGVQAQPALELAGRYGMRVMVIDHHQIQQDVLCEVLYHTELLSSWFQNQCASGLIATLMDAMERLDDYDLALAAIGTIGDIMILKQHNRYLVQAGIQQLNQHRFEPLERLLKRSVKEYDAQVVSFNIVPVLNAVGRLNDPSVKIYQMVAYLKDPMRAGLQQIAQIIKTINERRKQITQDHIRQAQQHIVANQNIQIILDPGFHEGIVGIVAGQLANEYQVPVLVGTQNQDIYKFSVRSPYLDIYSSLETYSARYFKSFGGHARACAFAIETAHYSDFRKELLAAFEHLSFEEPIFDVVALKPEDLTWANFNDLAAYAPFGQGFEKLPVVIEADLQKSFPIREIGRKWTIRNAQDLIEAITFGPDKNLDISDTKALLVGELQKTYSQKKLSILASKIMI